MAQAQLKVALTNILLPKGQWADMAGLADGTPFSADWLLRQSLAGRMFVANAGSGTAPFTGGGAYVNTAPDLDMSVPAGILVIPISITIQFETFGTSLLNEVVAVVGGGGVIVPTSATDVVPVSTRVDAPYASKLNGNIKSDGTGATYMTKNVDEFWRDGSQFSISKTSASATAASQDPQKFKWTARETGIWPIMYDPSGIVRLNIFGASQAPTMFITVVYVEPDPGLMLG